jgi:hypothetical protein
MVARECALKSAILNMKGTRCGMEERLKLSRDSEAEEEELLCTASLLEVFGILFTLGRILSLPSGISIASCSDQRRSTRRH